MNIIEYWDLIETHPWVHKIPADLWVKRQRRLSDPDVICFYLIPSKIVDSIRRIQFCPWKELHQSEETVQMRTRVEGFAPNRRYSGWFVNYVCYWHKKNESHGQGQFCSRNLDLKEGKTVGDLIKSVEIRSGVVDLIVRVITIQLHDAFEPTAPDKPFVNSLVEGLSIRCKNEDCLDLFLPNQK